MPGHAEQGQTRQSHPGHLIHVEFCLPYYMYGVAAFRRISISTTDAGSAFSKQLALRRIVIEIVITRAEYTVPIPRPPVGKVVALDVAE